MMKSRLLWTGIVYLVLALSMVVWIEIYARGAPPKTKVSKPMNEYGVNLERIVDGQSVDLTFNLGSARIGDLGLGVEIKAVMDQAVGGSTEVVKFPTTVITLKHRCSLRGVENNSASKADQYLRSSHPLLTAKVDPKNLYDKAGRILVTLFDENGKNLNQLIDSHLGSLDESN